VYLLRIKHNIRRFREVTEIAKQLEVRWVVCPGLRKWQDVVNAQMVIGRQDTAKIREATLTSTLVTVEHCSF